MNYGLSSSGEIGPWGETPDVYYNYLNIFGITEGSLG